MAEEESQSGPSSTIRTTRMIFVEEISDNETENVEKSYKSIEMKTKFTVDASPKSARKTRAKSPTKKKSSENANKEKSKKSTEDVTDGNFKKPTTSVIVEDELLNLEDEIVQVDKKMKDADHSFPSVSAKLLKKVGVFKDVKSNADQGFEPDVPKKTSRGQKISSVRPSLSDGKPVAGRAPRNMNTHDELSSVTDTLLYDKLKLLIMFMKVAGLFYVRRKRSHHTGIRGFILNCTLLQAYCIVMNVLLLANFLRSLWMFDGTEEFGSLLFFKFLVVIFFYEAVSRALLAFAACWNKEHGIHTIFRELETICYPDSIIPYEDSLRKTVVYMLILSFVVSLANVAALAYGVLGPSDVQSVFSIYYAPLSPDTKGIIGFEIALFIITFVNSMVAMLSLTFYTICCYILHKEFEYFARTFSMKISPDGRFLDDLERFRIRHQRRCTIVEEGDHLFKYYIANTYLTNVPLLCLLLYSVVYTDQSANEFSMRLISVYRMSYVFLQMMVLSVVSTMINTQAHAPLSSIYSIRIAEANVTQQMEMTMFLNKITGTQIGLTAWDLFIINKPTVLTVVGMILTYFFLLVQFKNPLQGATVCNCFFDNNGTNISLPALDLI